MESSTALTAVLLVLLVVVDVPVDVVEGVNDRVVDVLVDVGPRMPRIFTDTAARLRCGEVICPKLLAVKLFQNKFYDDR